ncbi:MAG: biopolymer transporter ExbD [Akkermansiaceae bacterium]|jgi:biopolymer transport protein ExbD|nr:biopolymer transporter ExbD [Akkermansiaceae bacterium]MDP4646087.1 biopolymer transporter ExbD [Akkermansiaceae bacterium]MDP4720886.1 biopolymer transporter ExbD [Akkermansiaceae bacterium]MDP4780755.1 biopolymer transporter ExbD [Akkermansiaceae bacterium]MDP4845701.1 biopolymer transporter ExbD [Akkermansiaceae bacterium]
MASKKLRSAPEEDEAKVDMSPMIDMVFLLLIFFIVNATAIIVKTDPEVMPPIAKNSKAQEDGRGRIVINVWEDGTYTSENLVQLPDETAIFEVVKAQKAEIDKLGIVPKLHLRGDQDAVFKYSRAAIRSAAAAGVDQVVFAVYPTHKGLKQK